VHNRSIHHFVDFIRTHIGAREQLPHGEDAELDGRHVLESGAGFGKRRSNAFNDRDSLTDPPSVHSLTLTRCCGSRKHTRMVDAIRIRPARDEDKRPIAELWTHAFPGERTLEDRMRSLEDGKPYGGLDVTFAADLRGRIVGAFKAYKMAESINGVLMPMTGLAAVAVSPDGRRRGIGKGMCRYALALARERGDIISVLYPFRPDFYKSLGWGLAGELHSYRFRPEALAPDDHSLSVRLANLADNDAIAACYDRVARRSNGLILRSPYVWKSMFSEPNAHAVVFDRGGIAGYALLVYGRGQSREQRPLFIHELIAETYDAYCGILGWISEQRDLWREVRYDARVDETFAFRLIDPRPPGERHARSLWDPVARVIRGPMLRIINVQEALQRRSYGGEKKLRIKLTVFDAELDDNRGECRVVFEDGRAEVSGWSGGKADVELSTTISALSQIYVGEITVSQAARLGGTSVAGDVAALDRVFATSERFWLLDEF
jgi:predicted acetyltransferase